MVKIHHSQLVEQEMRRLAAEDTEYKGDKPHLKFNQLALSNVVEEVEKDKENIEVINKLMEQWNSAPPRVIQIK